jgi:hypothetical protein
MAGASIPLTPAVHQMIDIGPCPASPTQGAIEYPIVRDMDTNMYERQDGAARDRLLRPPPDPARRRTRSPRSRSRRCRPTELPFTQDDFALQLEHALELMPEIVGDESVGIKYAINGLLSLTPDGLPLLGETPEVQGLWSAPRCGSRRGRASARGVAEWMDHGEPEIDPPGVRHRALLPVPADRRARQGAAPPRRSTRPTDRPPAEQWSSNGQSSLSPFHARERALEAVFYEASAGSDRTGTRPTSRLVRGVRRRRTARRMWDSRWWSPIINAEHLAMRDRAAMFDLTPSASST